MPSPAASFSTCIDCSKRSSVSDGTPFTRTRRGGGRANQGPCRASSSTAGASALTRSPRCASESKAVNRGAWRASDRSGLQAAASRAWSASGRRVRGGRCAPRRRGRGPARAGVAGGLGPLGGRWAGPFGEGFERLSLGRLVEPAGRRGEGARSPSEFGQQSGGGQHRQSRRDVVFFFFTASRAFPHWPWPAPSQSFSPAAAVRPGRDARQAAIVESNRMGRSTRSSARRGGRAGLLPAASGASPASGECYCLRPSAGEGPASMPGAGLTGVGVAGWPLR